MMNGMSLCRATTTRLGAKARVVYEAKCLDDSRDHDIAHGIHNVDTLANGWTCYRSRCRHHEMTAAQKVPVNQFAHIPRMESKPI